LNYFIAPDKKFIFKLRHYHNIEYITRGIHAHSKMAYLMMTEDLMIHGKVPRSTPAREKRQPRSNRNLRPPRLPAQPIADSPAKALHGWEICVRLDKELQTQGTRNGEPWRPQCRTRIEEDTVILPLLIARIVCEEASRWLGEPFPVQWQAELALHADMLYQRNSKIRQIIRKRGNAGRDWLLAFMRHWLFALLDSRRPELCRRLPASYWSGRDLPPPDTVQPRHLCPLRPD
jgi:hypothetical protein